MDDHEILLLSWTQISAMEWMDPSGSYNHDKENIEEALLVEFDIVHPKLIGRSFGIYKVAYERKGEPEEITFDADDVESIFDA